MEDLKLNDLRLEDLESCWGPPVGLFESIADLEVSDRKFARLLSNLSSEISEEWMPLVLIEVAKTRPIVFEKIARKELRGEAELVLVVIKALKNINISDFDFNCNYLYYLLCPSTGKYREDRLMRSLVIGLVMIWRPNLYEALNC